MRDLVVTLIVLGSLPYIFYRPHIGVYMWSWIGYMNPHKISWGFASSMPFAQIIAIVTLMSLFASKDKKKIPWTRETITLIILLIWMFITTMNAFYFDQAFDKYTQILKIQLMTFITLMLITTPERIKIFMWVVALSIGFFGIKGGIFTIMTGGGERVWGPPGTFIGGNNEIGLALTMIIPLLRFLQLTVDKKIIKLALLGAMILCLAAIVGTQSRGALVAITAMLFFLVLKSRKKFLFFGVLVIVVPIIFMAMPEKWHDRMASIGNYETDASALGRFDSWNMATNLAMRRITGGGFETFKERIFDQYLGGTGGAFDAHSIYFEVLGEQGFIGLILWLMLWLMTWRTGSWIIKHSKGIQKLTWADDLARMIQVSFVAYATGGAFLGLAYFDLPYHLMAIMVITKILVEKELKKMRDTEEIPSTA